jgi:hypothetical protein
MLQKSHRLRAAFRQINNRQSRVHQSGPTLWISPYVRTIRPSVTQCRNQRVLVTSDVFAEPTADATHRGKLGKPKEESRNGYFTIET